jgi:two-component system, NtrC family, sensor kinase
MPFIPGAKPIAEASILIVDDEVVNRALLKAMLATDGYGTVEAASGEEALRRVEQKPPDLILLDVMMPGMSGFDVAERLKGNARTRNIPIIIVTALDDHDSRMTALSKGAEEFLSKPVDRSELTARVRNLVRLKRYQDYLAEHALVLESQVEEHSRQLAAANTRLGEAQQRLFQAEKLASIGQLAAGVAHEINNPIAFVSGNLDSLQVDVSSLLRLIDAYAEMEALLPDAEPAKENLRQLKGSVDLAYLRADLPQLILESKAGVQRVAQIVKNLMDFSSAERPQEWVCVDLRQCMDKTLDVAANLIKSHIDVVREYGEIPLVECLPPQLEQVFLNLLVNAAQAIPEGTHGVITVGAGAAENEVWVEVRDTGCGIPPSDMKHLFDPFFTTKPQGVGTGLGLSIAYGIVELHHGRIEVESQVGSGSRFRVVLPLRQPGR